MDAPPTIAQVLRECRPARRLWLAQLVSDLGNWLNLAALFFLARRTGAGAQGLGGVLILQLAPIVLLGPIAGVAADRFDRRRILIAADLARAAVVLGFLFVDRPERLWLLYVLAVLQFSFAGFFEPARQAYMPSIAAREQLPALNALTSATMSVTGAVGGAIGGAVLVGAGPYAAFLLDAASFLVSAAFLSGLPSDRDRRGDVGQPARDARGLRTALAFLARTPRAAALLFAKAGAAVSSGGLWLLVVVFGQRLFPLGREGALSVGILQSAQGLGSIAGALLARHLFAGLAARADASDPAPFRAPVRTLLRIYLARAAFLALLGLAGNLAWAAAAIMGIAATGSLTWIASMTLLQRLTPAELRGRVLALDNSLFLVTFMTSTFLVGYGIDGGWYSPRMSAEAAAGAALAFAAAWSYVVLRWDRWTPRASPRAVPP